MLYARPDPNRPSVNDVRDFETPPPAAKGWRPLTVPEQPVPSATQVVVDAGIVFTPDTATQQWALREKAAAELEGEALKDEKAQLDGWLDDIQTQLALGNAERALLTNAQRISELEKDTRVLLKAAKRFVRQEKRSA
jgi:hypothetical protein